MAGVSGSRLHHSVKCTLSTRINIINKKILAYNVAILLVSMWFAFGINLVNWLMTVELSKLVQCPLVERTPELSCIFFSAGRLIGSYELQPIKFVHLPTSAIYEYKAHTFTTNCLEAHAS